jgi:hypothetical protein
MADQKPAQHVPEPKQADPPEPKKDPEPKKAPLGSAAASSNPLVHQLLAERNIMASVDDKDAVKALDAQLADLGVSVDA